jgi:hypothetical protein
VEHQNFLYSHCHYLLAFDYLFVGLMRKLLHIPLLLFYKLFALLFPHRD